MAKDTLFAVITRSDTASKSFDLIIANAKLYTLILVMQTTFLNLAHLPLISSTLSIGSLSTIIIKSSSITLA